MFKKRTKTEKIPATPLGFLWFTCRENWKWGVPTLLFAMSASLLADIQPFLLGKIIDLINSGGDVESVWIWVGIFVLSMTGMFLGFRLSGVVGSKFVLEVERFGHVVLTSYLLGHSHRYYINRFSGAVSQKISNAADGAEHLANAFVWDYIPMFVTFIVTLLFLFSAEPLLAYLFLFVIFLILFIDYFFLKKIRRLSTEYAKTTSAFRGGLVDVFTNIVAVRQYVGAKSEFNHINGLATSRLKAGRRRWLWSEAMNATNNVIIVLFYGIIFFYASYLWSVGSITVGELVMVITLMLRVQGMLVFIGNTLRQFIAQYGQMNEGLDDILTEREIIDARGARTLEVPDGAIAFEQVHFSFDNQKVFEYFNLKIKPGEKIGLVGQSGAGKTTLMSLLLRQHDLDGGAILIDKQDIASVTQDSLRQAIATVPQESSLFHRTIFENIAYGKPGATKEEVVAVAQKAEAHTFISTLPEGYDTLVGERGVKLSGGQRQRIAIARAMLKNAPILLLDEATSALDSESEAAIQKALHELMEGKTVIAIAHRLSTLREMDRIVVLENGQVVEEGTHHKLVRAKGVYARLWNHQAGGFLQE